MKLISTDRLSPEQRQQLAIAARKKRPNAGYRKQFAQLTQYRRELRQNRPAEVARRNGNA
jgi:hypothetical protein